MLNLTFDLNDFKKNYLLKSAVFIPHAFKADSTAHLKEFYRILLNPLKGSHNNLVRVINQTEVIDPEKWSHTFPRDSGTYRDISAILKAIALKSSIIFDEYYRYSQEAKELVAFVQQQFNCISACNAYLSQENSAAYAAHRDCHHVLIFALSGKKRWKVFNKKQEMYHAHNLIEPLYRPEEILAEGTYLDTIMQPGDLLYIPVGQYHVVENLTKNALHLTISMRFKTQFSLLDDVLDALLQPETIAKLTEDAHKILNKIHPIYNNEGLITEKDMLQATEELFRVITEVVRDKAFISGQHKVNKNNHLKVFLTPTDEFIEELACLE